MRFVALLFLSCVAVLEAAPLKRDLGRNLVFHRVQELPGDLPAMEPTRKQPAVLDVRYVHGDAASAAALQVWLRAHAALRTPVFVLANAETSPALLAKSDLAHVLVIGAAGDGFTPDIAVQTTRQDERRAYDALASGTDVSALITENSDKVRNDEASLSRDRATEPGAEAVAGVPKDRPAAPPIDAALQRAVHLHRALVALKKL